MPDLLIQKLEQNLRDRAVLKPEDKFAIACSGGPDSVALFFLLKSLQAEWKFKITLLHFNHGLRGKQAAADEKFVRMLARKTGTPYFAGRGKTGKLSKKEKFSLEEAARTARYAFFEKISRRLKIGKILTGHTLNDQAETVLMRVFQGTGLRGLCGVREVLRWNKIHYVRPLLGVSRKEILAYLKENKIPFRKDKSNDSLRFLRNRIRLRFLPQLEKEINPRIVEALARIPESLAREEEALSYWEAQTWNSFARPGKNAVVFKRGEFLKLPEAVQFRILGLGLKKLNPKSGMDFNHWKRVALVLGQKRGRISLPKDLELVLSPSELKLCKKR